MLFSFLLLGLLPAAFLFTDGGDAEEDGESQDAGSGAGGSASEGVAEPATGPDQPGGASDGGAPDDKVGDDVASGDAAQSYELPAGCGDTAIDDFHPGTDRLTVGLASCDTDISAGNDPDSGTPALHLSDDSGDWHLSFPGLDSVPVADIRFSVTDPGTGETTYYSLAGPQAGDGEALDPSDPDAPEALTPAEPCDTALEPVDPEAPDVLTPAEPGDVPLDPLDPEAPELLTQAQPGETSLDPLNPEAPDALTPAEPGDAPLDPLDPGNAEALTPGDKADAALNPSDPAEPEVLTLSMGGDAGEQHDPQTGEDGELDDWMPALIAGFQPGEDVLRLALDPADYDAAPEVTVGPSADGQDGEVWIDGQLIAVLAGAPGAGAADVVVEFEGTTPG